MKKYTANQIADWFLLSLDTSAGDTISPLKLQKLIYYAQAWHLVIFDRQPLFDEQIEAWVHGPVVRSVFERFSEYCKDCAIDPDRIALEEVDFEPQTVDLLNDVLSIYGEHSARYLEDLTHSEAPWIEARKGLPVYARSIEEITQEAMIQYYSQLRNGKQSQSA